MTISLVNYPDTTQTSSFTVTVNPCQVTSLTALLLNVPISYTVRSEATYGADYSFNQEPNCGYPQTLTFISAPPDFMEHLESEQRFSVQTSDPNDEQTYTIRMQSEIQVPLDYQMLEFQSVTQLISFEVTV